MAALTLSGALILGLAFYVVEALAVAFGRALRTYSRSRLQIVCGSKGRPGLAAAIEHDDERTERAAEAVAVVVEIAVAAWLVGNLMPGDRALAVSTAALVTIVVHFTASVLSRVWAETFLATFWPLAIVLRRIAWPLTTLAALAEAFANYLAGPAEAAPRPASVEVEILPDGDHPEVAEADVSPTTRTLLEHVVGLTRVVASELMTPRSLVVSLPATVTAKQAAEKFCETGLSCIPIFGENRDDILGLLHDHDLFPLLINPEATAEPVQPRKLVRAAFFVPESKNANDLLAEMRARRLKVAIVLDEYGGMAGLVTIEDLFDQLVGPIEEGTDSAERDERIKPLGEGRFEVDANVPLRQINHRFRLHLPTEGKYQTMGSYAFNELGRLPNPGEVFRVEGVQITILEVVERSIRRILMELG